jgi:copper oxidase (laccase) domain-containing protein
VVVVKNAPVAVVTADCAPVVLVDDSGASLAVVHAGWRGLVDGVVDGAVATMRARNREAETISAALGPCIRPECYEFSPADLDNIEGELGATVRGVTSDGKPALDMPAAVRAVLARNDVVLAHDEGACTAHTPGYWSHRARADAQRQATVAWLT